jgi:metallo-beta-lactamase family protein
MMTALKWHFLGGVRTVTGSCHILEVDGERVLVDCGLFQGHRKEAEQRNRELPFDPTRITRAVLGHAHIDHSGNLPMLVKNGYAESIYSTHATRDLVALMLRDAAHIQAKDAEFVNKREGRRGKNQVQPLYDENDVEATLSLFRTSGYRKAFFPTPRIRATFYPAGHILGSALTLFEVDNVGQALRILYAVDLGRRDLPILKDPSQVTDIDVLIIESTYGNREHEDMAGAQDRLARVIQETVARGGKVIVPAFALGRTQEIVRSIAQLIEERRIPTIPVYVDSPLAVNITTVFSTHPEEFDRETYDEIVRGGDPLGARYVRYITSTDESKQLNEKTEPCIIISASGMCEAGRILHHLRNNIEDPKNTIAIVGYQAQDTLGRRLVERQDEVRIFGEPFQRRAQVELLNAYSAHADQSDLLDFIQHTGRRLRQIYLVHGESEPQLALLEKINALGYTGVRVPETGEAVDLR